MKKKSARASKTATTAPVAVDEMDTGVLQRGDGMMPIVGLGEDATARLAAIVESSTDAIIGKDLRGIVTSWNAAAENIFGYTAAEMIGQPFARLIPAERLAEEVEILRKIGAGETIKSFETVRVRKNGTTIQISATISPIRNAAGKITTNENGGD